MYEYLATLQANRPHGTAFEYRSCETDILGWVCERASGVRMPELLSTLIWSRIGAEQDMDAAVDPAGAVFHDGGLAATLRDLGRFGQMLLDGGAVGGEQVVPAVVDRRQPGRRRPIPGRSSRLRAMRPGCRAAATATSSGCRATGGRCCSAWASTAS